jgi:hypothetical protein
VRRSLSLLALALFGTLASGCDTCGLIEQQIIVAADDPELGGLISDCEKGVPAPADLMCTWPRPAQSTNPTIDCSCLPLCERVYAIVNADPQRPPLVGCNFSLDPMGRADVRIEYRSRCE